MFLAPTIKKPKENQCFTPWRPMGSPWGADGAPQDGPSKFGVGQEGIWRMRLARNGPTQIGIVQQWPHRDGIGHELTSRGAFGDLLGPLGFTLEARGATKRSQQRTRSPQGFDDV